MITLRCTKKLQRHLGVTPDPEDRRRQDPQRREGTHHRQDRAIRRKALQG